MAVPGLIPEDKRVTLVSPDGTDEDTPVTTHDLVRLKASGWRLKQAEQPEQSAGKESEQSAGKESEQSGGKANESYSPTVVPGSSSGTGSKAKDEKSKETSG